MCWWHRQMYQEENEEGRKRAVEGAEVEAEERKRHLDVTALTGDLKRRLADL